MRCELRLDPSRPVGTRLLSALDRLAPTVREVWSFGLMAGIPLAILCGSRLWLVGQLSRTASIDRLHVMVGEAEFWAAWFFFWMYVSRLAPRAGRLLGHLLALPILAASQLELLFFHVTGGRADLDSVAYALGELERVWPVVSSELKPVHWATIGGLCALQLAPLAWRPASEARRVWTRLLLLAAYPLLLLASYGRVECSRSAAPLQDQLVVTLLLELEARRHDRDVAPVPADLAPLRIEAPRRPANVVFVMLESVGIRHTTLWDPEIKSTPNLAKMAREGLNVPQLYAVVPHTTKALVSTLCGDWPEPVGDADEARPGGLPGECLPQLLAERGYRTAFFQPARAEFEDRADLVHRMGFQTFRPRLALNQRTWESNNYLGIDDRSMLAPGLEWSAESPEQPFFATYLTLASHHDYQVPSHWPLLDFPGVRGEVEQYRNAIRYVDDFLGRLVRAYEERGLADDTLFVVVGDHGEGFGEHGRLQHDLTIYDEGLHVPAVLWGAPLQGRSGTIDGIRQQIDLLPTVLELLDAPLTGRTPRGRSLLQPAEDRPIYHACWRSHRCTARRDARGKFIDHYAEQDPEWFAAGDELEQAPAALPEAEQQAALDDLRVWTGTVRGRMAERRARWLETIQAPDDSPAVQRWGDVSLLGCRVQQAEVVPGEPVWVTCRFRAERALTEAWRLRLQVERETELAVDAGPPLMGVFPMWDWRPGWGLSVEARVTVPIGAPPGTATLRIGWAQGRADPVPTADGREWIDIGTVEVARRRKANPVGIDGIRLREPPVPPDDFALPPLAE